MELFDLHVFVFILLTKDSFFLIVSFNLLLEFVLYIFKLISSYLFIVLFLY